MDDPYQSKLADSEAALQPFLTAVQDLARAANASSLTLRPLILKVLQEPDIFCGYDQIKAASKEATQDSPALGRTLDLFSYGTLADYQAAAPDTYLALNDAQMFKLRQLTVLSMVQNLRLSTSGSVLHYSTVQTALRAHDQTAVQDVLISLVYARVLHGQLCQKTQRFFLTGPCLSRDVSISQVQSILLPRIKELQEAVRTSEREWSGEAKGVAAGLHAWETYCIKVREKQTAVQNESLSLFRGGGNDPGSARRQKRSRGGPLDSASRPFQL